MTGSTASGSASSLQTTQTLGTADALCTAKAGGAHTATLERAAIRVTWARHQDEVRAAQRLRHDVFAGEMGARLNTPIPGHDIDLFDNFCEHLLVIDAASEQVIGTYRVLDTGAGTARGQHLQRHGV
jgi:putative hemolysin